MEKEKEAEKEKEKEKEAEKEKEKEKEKEREKEKVKSPEELVRERELAKLAPLEGEAAIAISLEFAGVVESPAVAEYDHVLSWFFFIKFLVVSLLLII
jgi:hypothetical protein